MAARLGASSDVIWFPDSSSTCTGPMADPQSLLACRIERRGMALADLEPGKLCQHWR